MDASMKGSSELKNESKSTADDAIASKKGPGMDVKTPETTSTSTSTSTSTTALITYSTAMSSSLTSKGYDSSEHSEQGVSDSEDVDIPSKVMRPRHAMSSKRLQRDLLLWGIPTYAMRTKLPDKATVTFDGDKKRWTSFYHDVRLFTIARAAIHCIVEQQPTNDQR
jgi:hypothetical protein